MLKDIAGNTLAELLVVVILAAWSILLLRWRRRRTRRAIATHQRTKHDAADTLTVLREQVLAVAKARSIRLPQRSQGVNPALVTFSDDTTIAYFRDKPSYVRAVTTGAVNPTRAYFNQRPPLPVSRWSESRLREWLDKFAD